jgi:hypothetical protein
MKIPSKFDTITADIKSFSMQENPFCQEFGINQTSSSGVVIIEAPEDKLVKSPLNFSKIFLNTKQQGPKFFSSAMACQQ